MKKSILILLIVLTFSSCLLKNKKVILLNKSEQNIILFEKEENKIFINSRLKERISSISNNEVEENTDLLRLSISINEFYSLKIKKFFIKVWEKTNGKFVRIVKGKIYFDEELLTYNNSYKIKEGVENLTIKSHSDYPLNTIFLVETTDSKRTFLSKEFIIEVDMSFVLNKKEYSIHKKDTLYRYESSKYQIRAH